MRGAPDELLCVVERYVGAIPLQQRRFPGLVHFAGHGAGAGKRNSVAVVQQRMVQAVELLMGEWQKIRVQK